MKAVEAVVQDGKLKLKKPLKYPDGTKALVTFLTESLLQEDAEKWFEQYYEQTKHLVLGEQFDIRDLFIASIVLANDLPFVTHNQRHFADFSNLRLAEIPL